MIATVPGRRSLLGPALLLGSALLLVSGCLAKIGDAAGAGGAGQVGYVPTGACDPPGAVEHCYPGNAVNESIGACQTGTVTCDEDHQWGACNGYQLPGDEACSDGLDNDCDGITDEGCGCEPGSSQACYTGPASTRGIGLCADGVQHCEAGSWSPSCQGEVTPVGESCDTLDNDCNGLVDDGCSCTSGATQSCYTGPPSTLGVGKCHAGTQQCNDGAWSTACGGEVGPSAEQCNGGDDDCDGQTDEGNPGSGGSCSTGQQGICAPGTWQCSDGTLECVQANQPTSESCNGEDDDCDGQTDEDNPGGGGSCSTGQKGICAPGTWQCTGGSVQCVQTSQPTSESCNGQDDNCNGKCDEQAGCRQSVNRSCHQTTGCHFYTISKPEASCCGFSVESYDYYYLSATAVPGTVPFYRCHITGSQYLSTTSSNCEGGGTNEGLLGHIATAAGCGATALYRLSNWGNGDHFYTTDPAERDSAVQGGFHYEGIPGYVWQGP